MADYVYRKLKNGNMIVIDGKVRTDGSIEIQEVYKVK